MHQVPFFLGDDSAQSFETPQKTIKATMHQVIRFYQDPIRLNVNKRTELIGQVRKYLYPDKSIFVFKYMEKQPMLHIVPSHVHWLKWLI